MSSPKQITLVVFGIGNVGSTLIQQINKVKDDLRASQSLEISIPVISNSTYAFFNRNGISNSWESNFKTGSLQYSINEIIDFVKKNEYKNCIAIDATSSEEFTKEYINLIENGFHIVSANKIANSLHYDFYVQLRQTLKQHQKSFLYETNVGAGLPVIETIKSLHQSGDYVQKIRGVFSGSLSYIFNEFSSKDVSFSKVLNAASKLGLTEPDAREDLSGKDVARKLLILARELDIKTELKDVKVQSLVPKYLNGKTTLHQFNFRKKELDDSFEKLKKEANTNEVLRYVAELNVEKKELEVKLINVENSSALGSLKNADSIFEVFTESYGSNPLVIQGAGAGKAVTARGLLSDIIKLSNRLN